MAADTRATGGSLVGDKNCEKVHYLAPNIYVCGAGTAADCDHVTSKCKDISLKYLTNYFIRHDQKRIGTSQTQHSLRE